MGSSFTLEDPFRATQYDGMKTADKAKLVFKDMGKGMWRQGLGFAKVGALYAGTECVVEGVSLLGFVSRRGSSLILLLDRESVSSEERHLEFHLRWCHLGSGPRTQFRAQGDDPRW
jgi:hypothetical protein